MRRLRDESGTGIITGVLLVGGLLVAVLFLIPLFARVEMAQMTAEQAVRDAVRSAVEAPTADTVQAAADDALSRARAGARDPLDLTLSGDWQRGGVLRADAQATVSIGRLPGLGRIGRISLRAHARAPIDRYRSLSTSSSP